MAQSTLILKVTIEDQEARLIALIEKAEPRLAALFTVLIQNVKNQFTLNELSDLLSQGRFEDAFDVAIRSAVRFSTATQAVFIGAGADTADFLTENLDKLISFDQTNVFAVEAFKRQRLQFIQQFTEDMRSTTQTAITEGITRGLNPREQARLFRDSIGLTSRQVSAIGNYRDALERNSVSALSRELRDKRFDSTVRTAASTNSPLSEKQIDRMVGRYSEKQLKWRSEMIARTESLRAVNSGSHEMFQQAVNDGDLQADSLKQEWHTARDDRVRDSHDGMNGQITDFNEPFISDAGNQLRFPGDPNAPASETINCRCAVSTRITNITI
jgi:hypothetical protein